MLSDDDDDVTRLEQGPPIDWTLGYDRFAWMVALREHVFQVYAEAHETLRTSRSPKHRRAAKRMFAHYACVGRLFVLAGFPRETWVTVHPPSPPWRSAEPPLVNNDPGGLAPDVFAPWPPLEWGSALERERWWWRLDGLCEHLAALALHVLGDRDHALRLRIEWGLSRVRSHLMRARPRAVGMTLGPELERVPALAFWVGWPRAGGELEP